MKKAFLLLLGCISVHVVCAQAPKWADKAKKAVFSVITYDENNNIKGTGNGFYIDSNGTALSDYTIFDGAYRAIVINANGKELPVTRICGANSIYDVLKLRTESDGKIEFIKPANTPGKIGETVYLLPYSTQKNAECQSGKITAVDTIGNNGYYYTISIKTSAKTVSCPIMNAQGEVLGLVQRNASDEDTSCYAIGATYGGGLSITALSTSDATLNRIHIQKAIPEDEQQALVYAFMLSSLNRDAYKITLDDLLSQFPQSYEGYLRRAGYYMEQPDEASRSLAQADLDKVLEVAENQSEAKYNLSKLLYNYALTYDTNHGGNPDWNFEKALSFVQEANAEAPQALYYQLEGDIDFALGKYPEAYTCYEKVNQSEFATAATFYSAAKTKQLIEGTDNKEILALMDSAVAKCVIPYTSDAAPYLFERGIIKSEMKDYRAAVKDFNDTYRAYNGSVNANFYFQREQAEVNSRMFQQALEDIERATELEPEDATLWLEKGSVHIRVAQMDEAMAALQKAIELDESLASAYRMLGYCQAQKKRNKEACVNFQKAKELGDEAVDSLMQKYCK